MQSPAPKLEVLISAMDIRSEEQLPPVAKQILSEGGSGLIINQVKTSTGFEMRSKNLRIVNVEERGISRSRNRALDHALGDLLLLTDDDVELLDGFSRTIVEAFDRHPEADMITFQSLNQDGEKRKAYSDKPFRHDLRTLMRVSSIEVALRRKSLEKKPLFFDERFGLGSQFPTGSETVFLSDALSKGFHIQYCPEAIVRHPDDSSGRALFKNEELMKAKGAMFCRIFGWKAYAICIFFALRKRKETGHSLYHSVKLMYSGIDQFKESGDDR